MGPAARFLVLCCVLLSLLPGPSGAVQRSDDGFGDVLIFPHAGGTATHDGLLSIWPAASATDFGQRQPVVARVVVRREHGPDQPSLITRAAATVFLAGNDGWTAALHATGLGTVLSTADTSCAFDDRGTALTNDIGWLLSGGLDDGWIEVYELGAVTDRTIAALVGARDCAALAAALPDAADDWLRAPANRLRGLLHLVDTDFGFSLTVAPTVLKDFRAAPWWQGLVDQHPDLSDVHPPSAAVRLPDGRTRISTFSNNPVDAVSAVLTDAEWELDFTVEPSLSAATDVLVLAPTHSWYAEGRAPFPEGNVPVLTARVHDREGRVATHASTKCSPMPPVLLQEGPDLDSPVEVLQLGPHGVLESRHAFPMQYLLLDDGICFRRGGALWEHVHAGRIALYFDDPGAGASPLRSDEGHEYVGLPVIGIGLTRIHASTHAGNAATYGLLQPPSRRTSYSP